MALISPRDRSVLREMFARSQGTARLLVFVDSSAGEKGCPYCGQTAELVKELAELSDRLSYEVVDVAQSPQVAELYGIDKVPALALLRGDGTDTRVRYFGIPAGYEFATLVEDLVDVASGTTRLSEQSRSKLSLIHQPIHIQVFVTPTCPYCPKAVRLAHQYAMESPFIRADMVEALEFPELADRYGVYGVPKTVINDSEEIEGAVPESALLRHVLMAAGVQA